MSIPTGSPLRAIIDESSRAAESLTFVAATAGTKRDGLDLDLRGLRTENYEANPVVLWAHDYFGRTLPIGRTVALRKQKTKIVARVEFDADDPFAAEVERKYRDGFLHAVSVGWRVLDWEPEDRRVTDSDLLDISAVPVPGDPDALMERARSYAIDLDAYRPFRKDHDSPSGHSAEEPGVDDTQPEEADAVITRDQAGALADALSILADQIRSFVEEEGGHADTELADALTAIRDAVAPIDQEDD